jgi:hypothetical protein
MGRSRGSHSQELERVRGELVDPDVTVARPVAPRRGDKSGIEFPAREVVVHHVYDAPPAPAAAPPVATRRVPVWVIVVAYFAMAIGIVLLVLALSSGPIIQPPHTPAPHHHRTSGR